MRPLLVGEINPYGSKPEFALYPLPKGASGDRLRRILGLSMREYLGFDRMNLCTGTWRIAKAREAAGRVLLEKRRPLVVLLGRRVAQAFGLADWAAFTRQGDYVLLPHPSGRCRLWNQPGSVERARRLVRRIL